MGYYVMGGTLGKLECFGVFDEFAPAKKLADAKRDEGVRNMRVLKHENESPSRFYRVYQA